jgi:hypothetical protein
MSRRFDPSLSTQQTHRFETQRRMPIHRFCSVVLVSPCRLVAAEVRSRCKQPQLRVAPLLRLHFQTTALLPQSHRVNAFQGSKPFRSDSHHQPPETLSFESCHNDLSLSRVE